MSTTPMLVSIPRSESLERARMTKNRISMPGSYTESAAGRRKSRRQDRTSTQSNENENRAARQANQIRNVAPTTSTPKEKQRRTSQSKIRSRERNTLLLLFLIWSATVCRNLQCTHTLNATLVARRLKWTYHVRPIVPLSHFRLHCQHCLGMCSGGLKV